MTPENVSTLSENGCKMIVEGAMATTSPAAIKAKKKGILLGSVQGGRPRRCYGKRYCH